jgi:hypothetical protein
MSEIPAEAVAAAKAAFAKVYNDPMTMTACLDAALAAAAPILVADCLKSAAREQFEGAIAAATEDAVGVRLAEIEATVRADERERLARLLDAEADGRYSAASASSHDGLRPPNGGHVAAGGAYEHAAQIVRGASS